MGYLKPIKRLSAADNKGSILQLQIARKADIDNIPEPVDGVVYGDIIFQSGRGWIEWETTLESPGIDSKDVDSREGPLKSNSLKFLIPKDRADVRVMFDRASEDEFIVLYKDGNGIKKLFGLLYMPVRFRYSHSSGTKFLDKNGYDAEFYYDGPDNIFEYNGITNTAPAGPAPAIVKFNGSPIASLAPGEVLNIISDFGFIEFHITS